MNFFSAILGGNAQAIRGANDTFNTALLTARDANAALYASVPQPNYKPLLIAGGAVLALGLIVWVARR